MSASPRRVSSGVILGAVVYAVGGAPCGGIWAWLAATFADDAEVNANSGGWFWFGVIVGAIVSAIVGGTAGAVERRTGRWVQASWIPPLVGLLLGLLVAAAGWRLDYFTAELILWPAVGIASGLLIHALFALIVATEGSPT